TQPIVASTPAASVTPTAVTTAPPAPATGAVALDHVRGTVLIAVANNLGATALCPLPLADAWPPSRWTTLRIQQCIAVRGIWSGGFLVLLALALGLEAHTFLAVRRSRRETMSSTGRVALARSAARLTAMGAPAATILLFAIGSASSFAPYQYSRYLIGIAIALPVVFATLWDHAPPLPRFAVLRIQTRRRHLSRLAVVAATLLVLITLLSGTLTTYGEIPTTRAYTSQQMALVSWLVQHDDTRIYSDYWTCLRAVFQSDEQVVCSVVGNQFEPKPNRYPPYDALVAASPHPAYVFQLAAGQVSAFPSFANQRGWTFSRDTVDGQFVVFRVLTP
ncbi:MAG: hypothetical protein ACRDHP_04060, partial [Ktedonobacterales bacterium]